MANEQLTMTDVEYSNRKRITKKDDFLNKMNSIVPWSEWVSLIQPYYPSGKRGRPVRGIETMLMWMPSEIVDQDISKAIKSPYITYYSNFPHEKFEKM